MQRITTQGIVLARTNFGEADRIVTFLTPDNGKISAMVKGVRKSQSKLAGGIELFSVSDITYIPGKRDVSTIVSTRLHKHYGNIVKDLDRTNTGYELIKTLNKATEDRPELDYFDLLNTAFAALDNAQISLDLIYVWFNAQLLRLAGHSPNMRSESDGTELVADQAYDFNFDTMSFQSTRSGHGLFTGDHIKFLRLIFSSNLPAALQKVQGANQLAASLRPLLQSMLSSFVRL